MALSSYSTIYSTKIAVGEAEGEENQVCGALLGVSLAHMTLENSTGFLQNLYAYYRPLYSTVSRLDK